MAHRPERAARRARRPISLTHATLRSALSEARRLQLVTINAAELVTVPKSTKRTDGAVNSGAVASVLSVCQHHRLGALLSVALAAGLRLGEATGLMWENVNLETGRASDSSATTACRKRTFVAAAKDREKPPNAHAASDLHAPWSWRPRRRAIASEKRAANALPTARTGESEMASISRSAAFRRKPLIAKGVQLAEVSMLLGHSELRVRLICIRSCNSRPQRRQRGTCRRSRTANGSDYRSTQKTEARER